MKDVELAPFVPPPPPSSSSPAIDAAAAEFLAWTRARRRNKVKLHGTPVGSKSLAHTPTIKIVKILVGWGNDGVTQGKSMKNVGQTIER